VVPAGVEGDGALTGVGVVVTRGEGEDKGLSAALRARGASVYHWPTTRWAPTTNPDRLAAALGRLKTFDWAVLTSPRAVAAVAEHVESVPDALRLAAVGQSTAEAARREGWRITLVPETQTAAALVAALGQAGVGPGTRVFFPASQIARTTVESGLRALGVEVERVTAYRTLAAPLDRESCRRTLDAGEVQVISFASPSSVNGLVAGLGAEMFREASKRVVMAAIGPTTSAAVRQAHAAHVIEAADHSLPGLVERIVVWARDHSQEERDELSDQ